MRENHISFNEEKNKSDTVKDRVGLTGLVLSMVNGHELTWGL